MTNNIIDFGKGQKIAEKAIILARVSSKEQEEGYSIDAQKHRLQQYCERRGLEVIKVFELVESSTQGDRRQFMDLIKFVKSQRRTIAIVADKVDRVQRSFKEYPLLDALIQENKIELHFNTENYIIHKGSMSQERLMWSMGVIMAQSYVDSLRDNVKRSIDHKLRIGEWIAAAPLGYLNKRDERGRSEIILDPDRVMLVRRIFEEYATGAYTLPGILEKTYTWGLKNARGKQGYLSVSQLHYIINNPFYYGRMKVKGKLYDHRYQPIISKETFNQCQAVLKGWNKKPFKWAGKEFVFRGLLTCATSGRLVSADTKTKVYKKTGEQAQWTYLRCRNPDNPEKYVFVREDAILQQVTDILLQFKIGPVALAEIIGEIKNSDKAERIFLRRQIGELQKEQNQLQTRTDSLMDMYLDGAIDKVEFERKKEALRNKQHDVANRMEQCRDSDDSFKNALVAMVSLVSDAHTSFVGSTTEKKREILNLLFANLSLKGTTLCYSLRQPFDQLLNCNDIEKWCALIITIRTNPDIRQTIINVYNQWRPVWEGFFPNE